MDLSWTVLALGFALGASLAAPPGPILVLSADRTVHRGFWAGLIVPIGAILGDATHALLMGYGVLPLVARVPHLLDLFAVGGALLLLFFARDAWQKARRPPDLAHAEGDDHGWSARHGILLGGLAAGYIFALSSPFNIGWWLSVGATLFQDHGPAVFVGFFAGLFVVVLAYVGGIRFAATRITWAVKAVSYTSAVLLVAFAGLVLWTGLDGLLTGLV